MTAATATTLSIPGLRAAVRGRVTTPADPDFDTARSVTYPTGGPGPAVIVRVADAADVATVIGFARETGLELAVRSGGHSGSGLGTTDGGLVIDLRDLRELSIDPGARLARAGSGLTSLEFTTAAAEHGLGVGFGDTGSVGLGGLVTGGGIGYLVRKHGLTIDSLVAAEVVTADGAIREVDAGHEPDLFWAIRGGGGNVGVVTRFTFRLNELGEVVGGMLFLPATPETVAGFVAAAEAAPEALSTIANVMPIPPMPFIPEEHHGKLAIMGMLVHAGEDVETGLVAVAPFRALAEPYADMLRPMAYPEIFPPEDPDYHPTAVAKQVFRDSFDAEAAALVVDRLETGSAPMRVAQIRVLGGAAARVPADATAFAHRDRPIMATVAAFYEGEADRPAKAAWVEAFADAIRQGDDAAYVNFVNDEGPERVRAAYPGATWDRLAAIKRRYDPDNLFRRNQNIPPAPAS